MIGLSEKFSRLKQRIGGNREKGSFEFSFGQPVEEARRITPPNADIRRVMSEIEFAIRLSKELDGKFDGELNSALDFLKEKMDLQGVLTGNDCAETEKMLSALVPYAKEYKVIYAAHAHIDMNWMWGWQETVASTVATFQTMLKLLEEYPQYKFSQSQASVYKIIEDYAPELKPQIEKYIAEGRWEVTATAWVETDKNMPSSASLLNHVYYTRKYLSEHWGVDKDNLDLDFSPDTFGHSINIPEIDSFAGIKYYYHCRGLQDNKVIYRWKAPSGNEVLVCREQYWYNSGITPEPAIGVIDVSKRSGGLKTGLAVYGVGDHGGGPTRRDIERGLEMASWQIFPQIVFGTFHDYFKEAETVYDKLPLVEGELNYFAPGCYTTQSRIKLANRHGEAALYDAQLENVLAKLHLGTSYDESQYESAWQNLLFTHFHDILTGSCVQETREHAIGLVAHTLSVAQTRASLSMQELSKNIDTSSIAIDEDYSDAQSEGAGAGYGLDALSGVPSPERGKGLTRIYHIYNTASVDRERCCEITVWDWVGDIARLEVVGADGKQLDFELLDSQVKEYWSHKYFRILVKAAVSAFGYTTVILRQKEAEEYPIYFNEGDRLHKVRKDIVLENDDLRAMFSQRNGEMYSLFDKKKNAELLVGGKTAGLRLVQTEHDSSSAWNIGRYVAVGEPFEAIKLQQFNGKLRSGFTMEQRVAGSAIKSTVSLSAGSGSIEIEVEADWNETAQGGATVPVLCYLLPTDVSGGCRCDVAGGAVVRTPAEVDIPALQYAAAISGDRALYISTDCKYGYRANKDGLISTLINSTYYPDKYPERGIHNLKLNIGVEENDSKALYEAAFSANHPFFYQSGGSQKGTLAIEGRLLDIELGSCVIAEIAQREGKIELCVYEVNGADSEIKISLPKGKSAYQVDFESAKATPLSEKNGKATANVPKNSFAIFELR